MDLDASPTAISHPSSSNFVESAADNFTRSEECSGTGDKYLETLTSPLHRPGFDSINPESIDQFNEENFTTFDNDEDTDDDEFVPPCERENAPLSGILRSEFQNIDPKLYFREFKRKKVLRFSRLFEVNPRTLMQNMIWWPSRTFFKKPGVNHGGSVKEPLLIGSPPLRIDCSRDQNELLLSKDQLNILDITDADEDSEASAWRFGPAQMWFDRMGVPTRPNNFDYGFKEKKQHRFGFGRKPITDHVLSEESLLPVHLLRWEDDIIFDGSAVRPKALEELNSGKEPKCGWVPTMQTRTFQAYKAACNEAVHSIDSTHSMFPVDSYDLDSLRWEDEVIYDPDNMPSIPKPKILTMEFDDDPRVFGMPDDVPSEDRLREDGRHIDRKENNFTKKSKMILGQVQRRQKQEEEEHLESAIAQIADKDPFNMSNDDYYSPKALQRPLGNSSLIQHSVPAQNIHRAFFPTYLNSSKLRHFHRMPITRKIFRDFISQSAEIQNLTKTMELAAAERERRSNLEGSAELFMMREVNDVSARDGRLLLIEYSEEHPPLLSQPGMASKIRNYYRRKTQKDAEPDFDIGETAFAMNSPFLGNLTPGLGLQAIENNMYRSPIYRHSTKTTDFLLFRHRRGIFIRELPTFFVAGQQCPLLEVPSPNSKRATSFARELILAFIYRLFWASEHKPRRLKMDDIKIAFPLNAESSVRKRLKQCAHFKRLGSGSEQNYWVIREDFRLPSKEEVLNMVTPEMCCAHYSMLAAEQRLKDAGYGEKYFLNNPENDDENDDQVTMEDEIKCAPWNTTRAYISAANGKYLLDQTGVADPTGCGQGFSYVRVSAKPQKEDVPHVPKRLVTGTNADLRKLPLKEAKEMCRDYGVREEEISALTRWEIIDVIRTLSTQAAKSRSDFSGMARFARGNIRFNFADMQDKYKQYCQHVFDLQNQILSCPDELETDEGSDAEDTDNDDMASRLEKMLEPEVVHKFGKGKVTMKVQKQVPEEMGEEEKERRDLQRMIRGDLPNDTKSKSSGKRSGEYGDAQSSAPRKLKISRTIRSADGTETVRVELVRNPLVIDAYEKIRTNYDYEFIKVYAQMDDQFKEERRKEKRRLQDQLRRLRRNEMKSKQTTGNIGRPPKKPVEKKPPPPPKASLLKMTCSACGEKGHMKTNKHCPLYGKDPKKKDKTTVADVCRSKGVDLKEMSLASGELMSVEGTKIKFSKKFFAHAQETKKNELKLRIPAQFIEQQKLQSASDEERQPSTSGTGRLELDIEEEFLQSRVEQPSPASTVGSSATRMSSGRMNPRRRSTIDEDYLMGPVKSIHRRRANPRVSMATILESIYTEFRSVAGVEPLMQPVNARKVPDYYKIIEKPMDLQQIRARINENKYELRSSFLNDVGLLYVNSKKYNGETHPITDAARSLTELAVSRIKDREKELIELEKAINPLLDDNDLVGFSYILTDIIQQCKNIPKSAAFHAKVDPRRAAKYYEMVENPMDLGTMEQKAKDKAYKTKDEFLSDIDQIYKNSVIFNGLGSNYTLKAKEITDLAHQLVKSKWSELHELESQILAPNIADSQSEFTENDEATMDVFNQFEEHESVPDVEPDAIEDVMPTDDDENTMDEWNSQGGQGLFGSRMFTAGRLGADLALSDSDSDEETLRKRPRFDEDLDAM